MTRIAVGDTSPTGLKWPHYVNGRLLTAQDLRAGQDAVLGRDSWLGQAVGSGVVSGLEVTGSPGSSVLHVSPGTGVSPGGTAVHLDTPAMLALTVVSTSAPLDGALFADCRPATTETVAPTAGAYLLTMAPASRYAGKVPVAGSPTAVMPTPCASRWQVEDVVFAAIRLDEFDTKTTPANRRNLLAHFCFGSATQDDLAMSAFTEPLPWRGIDGLPEVTPCDVLLGVFDWDGAVLKFVDRWSARRRTVRSSATVALAAVVGDERTADGEARFLQFQDQLDGLTSTAAGLSMRALDVFPVLPPAGLVPIDTLAAAQHLLKQEPDFTPTPGKGLPATIAHPSKATLRKLLIKNIREDTVAAFSTSRLGLISQELLQLQQQINALRAELDTLTATVAGVKGKGGSASARAEGRKLAAAVAGSLLDSTGHGFDPATFFDGIQVRIGVVDHETVDYTIRRSWCDEPIDLGRGTVLNVYFVLSSDGETAAPYLLFNKRLRGVRWITSTPRSFET